MIFRNNPDSILEKKLDRRSFLAVGLAAAASCIIPSHLSAAMVEKDQPERTLCFFNPYSDEELKTVYWKDGQYISEGLGSINHILRDIRTGRVKAMDKKLLDLLFDVQQQLDISKPFLIVSGYRTPRSNAILMKRKKIISRKSMHIYGKAVDIKVPGYSTKEIRRIAMRLKKGGVGYYPRSGTLHLDVGNVRYWRG